MCVDTLDINKLGYDSFEKFLVSFKRLGAGALDMTKAPMVNFNNYILADPTCERANKYIQLKQPIFDKFLHERHSISPVGSRFKLRITALLKDGDNSKYVIVHTTDSADRSQSHRLDYTVRNILDYVWTSYASNIGADSTCLVSMYKEIFIHGV
jgi:hypothetical protein